MLLSEGKIGMTWRSRGENMKRSKEIIFRVNRGGLSDLGALNKFNVQGRNTITIILFYA